MNRREAFKGLVGVGAGLLGSTAIAKTTDSNDLKLVLAESPITTHTETYLIDSDPKNRFVFTEPVSKKKFAIDGQFFAMCGYFMANGIRHPLADRIAPNQTIKGCFLGSNHQVELRIDDIYLFYNHESLNA